MNDADKLELSETHIIDEGDGPMERMGVMKVKIYVGYRGCIFCVSTLEY